MQQHVGVLQLLQRGLEGLHQVGRQLADEADGVGDERLLSLVQLQAPRRGVQGVEEPVVGRDLRAGQGVQKRGLARVGISDDGHDGHGVALAPLALDAADLAHLFKLLAQLLYLAPDVAAVGLQLGLAGAARAYWRRPARSGLAHQVGPHARQPGQQVFVLRQLHLELALARAGALGEDVQDEAGAVQHLHAQLLGQHAVLRGGELVVEDREVALRVGYELLELGHLALADERARVRRRTLLEHHARDLAAGGVHELRELLHGDVRAPLVRIHGRGGESGEHSALPLLCRIVYI